MELKLKLLFATGLLLFCSTVFSQITKSLYVQSPCTATLIYGNKEISEYDLTIFPNPNDGLFSIQLDQANNHSEIKISVINGLGQTILDKKAELKDKRIEVDLRGSSRGLYMIRLIIGKDVILKKFIISF